MLAEQVIEIPVAVAPRRGVAIAAALTSVLRAGDEPGEVLDVSRSADEESWVVRVMVEGEEKRT